MLSSTRFTQSVLSQSDEKDSSKLAAVRGYRNKLLHFIAHQHEASTSSEDDPYLLLMEMMELYVTMRWSLLSPITSREMKRACLLCIDTLQGLFRLHNLDAALHQTHIQFVENLLSEFTIGKCISENTVYALQQILIHTVTRDIVLSSGEYILQILRIVHQSTTENHIHNLLLLGKQASSEKDPVLREPLDYTLNWVPIGKALELAAQLCNILKLIFSPLVSWIQYAENTTWEMMKSQLKNKHKDSSTLLDELRELSFTLIQDLVVPVLFSQIASTNESLSISAIVFVQALRLRWAIILEDEDDHSTRLVLAACLLTFTCLLYPSIISIQQASLLGTDVVLTTQMQDLTINSTTHVFEEQQEGYRTQLESFFDTFLHHFRSLLGLQLEMDQHHSILSTFQDDVGKIWYPFCGNKIPAINQVALARGLVTVLDESILFYSFPYIALPKILQSSSFTGSYFAVNEASSQVCLWMYPISSYIIHIAQNSTDNGVRLSAVKGLDTLLGRIKDCIQSLQQNSALRGKGSEGKVQQHSLSSETLLKNIHNFARQCLDVCFTAWENQACRQVVYALPNLFQSVLDVMDKASKSLDNMNRADNIHLSIESLAQYILMQPVHRKGRYVALELLLPTLGASKLLALSACEKPSNVESNGDSLHTSQPTLISSLISGFCERGKNARSVCDLLVRILSLLKTEMQKEAGIHLDDTILENRKQRRKRISQAKKGGISAKISTEQGESMLLPSWMQVWMGPLSLALLQENKSGRWQISMLFLPNVSTLIGGSMHQVDLCHVFSCLLDELVAQSKILGFSSYPHFSEVLLWAKLEVCTHVTNQCRSSPPSVILNYTIRRVLGQNEFENALRHNNPDIRLAAFRSLEVVVSSLYQVQDNCDNIKAQYETEMVLDDKVPLDYSKVEYWKKNLRYAVKVADKGYILHLLASAMHLADRLLSENTSLFDDFVVEFLIKSIFLDLTYPGTVSVKEEFSLQLVEHIFALVRAVEESLQKPSDLQRKVVERVKLALLSEDVLNSLHNLIHSSWESTRTNSFQFLCKLLIMSKRSNIPLPLSWKAYSSIVILKVRAMHLTSSPRPKEADTGARILAMLSMIDTDLCRELVNLLDERLAVMQSSLRAFLSHTLFSGVSSSESKNYVGTVLSTSPTNLPLAHGFMLALRLTIECNISNNSTLDFQRVSVLCNQAIEMSLVVVADIIDDLADEESADKNAWKTVLSSRVSSSSRNDGTPLNINTGALGANASFASIKFSSTEDSNRRALTQRIVIGTWLLTKEACATLASVIKHYPGGAPSSVIESAGYLLISILMTLKHQGGAHAAHKALQEISTVCYSYTTKMNTDTDACTSEYINTNIVDDKVFPSNEHAGVGTFPLKWIQIILREISTRETVRDSTLRRSTGFALGILSLLRGAPRQVVSFTMEKLLLLSDEKNNDNRSRVHALNILKVVVLDAALKAAINSFVDHCLISAFVGYTSPCWTVKNSATMMLSAVMLHAVDSHKNSDAFVEQNESARGRAIISVKDLHFFFPSSFRFIVNTIALNKTNDRCADFDSDDGEKNVLFPLLLLVSRLQPTSLAHSDNNSCALAGLLCPHIIKCLSHRHNKVRLVASRALAVLCTDDDSQSSSSRRNLLQSCLNMLSKLNQFDWNSIHGALLGIHALLTTACVDRYIDESFLEIILYYSSWAGWTLACPPACASIALDIWFHITKRSSVANIIRGMHISNVALDLCSIIDRMASQNLDSFMISTSVLAFASSRIAVEQILYETFVMHNFDGVDRLERLLRGSSWDIRLQAVKALKKFLSNYLLELRNVSIDTDSKINIICRLISLFMRSMQYTESLSLQSFDASSIGNLHSPTLRRLSRCALDCLDALNTLDCESCAKYIREYDIQCHLWKFLEIVALKKLSDQVDISNDAFSGNLIELMSFVLFSESWYRCEAEKSLPLAHARVLLPEECRRIRLFEALIDHAIQPHGYWRVRYSVAIAIGTSGINTALLINCTMTLLQDHDGDVREAAIRSANNGKEVIEYFGRSIIDEKPDGDRYNCTDQMFCRTFCRKSINTAECVDLFVLEKFYATLNEHYSSDSEDTLVLLLRQFKIFDDREMSKVMDDYEDFHSSNSRSSLEVETLSCILTNTSNKRKIFEEEEANPYEESLLMAHHAAVALLKQFSPSTLDKRKRTVLHETSSIMMKGALILDTLKTNGSDSIWLDLSRSNRLFCAMHAISIGLSVLIYLGLHSNEESKLLTIQTNVVQLLLKNETVLTLHPRIIDALKVISTTKVGCEESKWSIIRCCFLSH